MARTGVDHNTLFAQAGDIRGRIRSGNHHDGALLVQVDRVFGPQSSRTGLLDQIILEFSGNGMHPIGANLVQDIETTKLTEYRCQRRR